ncbi:MAG: trypsin-like peptidase domain-containing protein [Bacteroidetes bacterium]|nr:trypsin-like peptidase domain-containing protein [Bacteroidota bacterium]
MKKILLLSSLSLLLSGCAAIFLPRNQKVNFTTSHKESKIYADKLLIGEGEDFRSKMRKNGAKQLVLKVPGYKDHNMVLMPYNRSVGYYLLQIPNPLWFVFAGFMVDSEEDKNFQFKKENYLPMPEEYKFNIRGNDDKFISISNVRIDIKDKNKDYRPVLTPHFFEGQIGKLNEMEIEYCNNLAKEELKKNNKKKKTEYLENPDEKSIKFTNTIFTDNIFKTLKNAGYTDTLNNFFLDVNNTIYLEANITGVTDFFVSSKKDLNNYLKSKFYITWYIKNNFNEIIDSLSTQYFSDDFLYYRGQRTVLKRDEAQRIAYVDAVENSFLKLMRDPVFKKYIKIENEFKNPEPALVLSPSASTITSKREAHMASVIVKTNKGHGSGFATTHDGYILTNYHVISDKYVGSFNEIKVITNDGVEHTAKVVRTNKYHDIALLKIERNFEKVFKISREKSFENHQEIFTIGAPKSVELGQTISNGVISNERKSFNTSLMQLSMSVNSGNSGGPLFDETGNLHGIIVSKAVGSNTEGISFAIPGYLIQEYLNITF